MEHFTPKRFTPGGRNSSELPFGRGTKQLYPTFQPLWGPYSRDRKTENRNRKPVSVGPSFGQSDHCSVQFNLLRQRQQRMGSCHEKVRNFRKMNVALAKHLLSQIVWDEIFRACTDVSDMWLAFKTSLESVFDSCVPWASACGFQRKTQYPAHVTKLQAKKRHLHKKWKRDGTEAMRLAYRIACRDCSAAVRNCRLRRESSILSAGSRAQFYRFINQQRSVHSGVAPLQSAGSYAVSDVDKATVLNNQFSSVFTHDNGHLPAFSNRTGGATFSSFVVTAEHVRKVLCKLDSKYERDPDGVPSAVLRSLSYELSVPLSIVFSKSLASGTIPSTWKSAFITALYKKGCPSDPQNYRPISITSAVCRVFERILVDHLTYYLRGLGVISEEQFGFRKGRSTELQLLTCINKWSSAIDKGFHTDVVYIDFARAFDSVCHSKLLYKLEYGYGITGNVLAWIRCFLDNRTQCVRVGTCCSEYKSVLSGVPQGSVIGPILFILYVNDIPDSIPPAITIKLFADDVKLFLSYRAATERSVLQTCINMLCAWSHIWQLLIRVAKCAVLTLGKTEPAVYSIDDQELPLVETVTDLGVLVDSRLSFAQHVSVLVRKANYSVSVLFQCFLTNNISALTLAYLSYVRPMLEYCCPVWSPCLHHRSSLSCLTSIDKLESVQRAFTRKLFKRCKLAETTYVNRLAFLKIDSLELRRLKASLCTVYKIVNSLVDVDCSDFFRFSARSGRGHHVKLELPRFAKDARENCFTVAIVAVWNRLPEDIVASHTLPCFKRRLSNYNDVLLQYCAFNRNL